MDTAGADQAAVAVAGGSSAATGTQAAPAGSESTPLSAREKEVLDLITKGFTAHRDHGGRAQPHCRRLDQRQIQNMAASWPHRRGPRLMPGWAASC
ncbi:hypothetical protein JL996_19245, partial [Acinetobacter baumannii]|uniref:hypothetical protein n=1 Tax=Acinetobacter baumannii TaxID=470 RepID=UPI001C436E7A